MSTALLEQPGIPESIEVDDLEPRVPVNWVMAVLTGIVVFGPVVALAGVLVRFWGHGVSLRDVVMAVVLYVIAGHGVTVGYHRLFTHRSFKANRPLKIALGLAGSLAFEGGVIAWVANHRCHHAHTDREGDPHSPVGVGRGLRAELGGLWHAHMGWMFNPPAVSNERYAPDMLADPDMRLVDKLFPVACVVTLAAPFGIGWLLGGTFGAALERPAMGRHHPDRPAAPHHVEHQLDLPHIRQAPVPHRRPQRQRPAAFDHLYGRVLAQRPPRLPGLGPPRR